MKKAAFYLTSSGFGGLEMITVNLAKWMTDKGWEIKLILADNPRLQKMAETYGLEFYILKRPHKYIDIVEAWRLNKILKKNDIHNLLVFDNYDLSTANFCKKLFAPHLKLVYQQHMQFKVKKTSIAHTFRFSGLDYWITPLESLKQKLMHITRIPERKIKVIPHGLDIRRFVHNPISKEAALRKLDIEKDVVVIGCLGRIAPAKGQMQVLKAFEKLYRSHPKLHLLIMGEPTINDDRCLAYDKLCKTFSQEYLPEDRVHFRPFRDDVEIFYSATDIFIMPSEAETYGLVTIEAMLSNIPVIGTNGGGTPELLNFGEYGQLFEFKNTSELVEKIENLLLKKYNFLEQVEKAKSYAQNNYSSNMMCERISALLE